MPHNGHKKKSKYLASPGGQQKPVDILYQQGKRKQKSKDSKETKPIGQREQKPWNRVQVKQDDKKLPNTARQR